MNTLKHITLADNGVSDNRENIYFLDGYEVEFVQY